MDSRSETHQIKRLIATVRREIDNIPYYNEEAQAEHRARVLPMLRDIKAYVKRREAYRADPPSSSRSPAVTRIAAQAEALHRDYAAVSTAAGARRVRVARAAAQRETERAAAAQAQRRARVGAR